MTTSGNILIVDLSVGYVAFAMNLSDENIFVLIISNRYNSFPYLIAGSSPGDDVL